MPGEERILLVVTVYDRKDDHAEYPTRYRNRWQDHAVHVRGRADPGQDLRACLSQRRYGRVPRRRTERRAGERRRGKRSRRETPICSRKGGRRYLRGVVLGQLR